MDSGEETPPPAGVPCPHPICRIRHDEMHERDKREMRNAARRRAAASRERERFGRKERSRKKVVAETSQPCATHTSSEDEGSNMSEVDASSHEGEELPDWMSQLFEKLDLELNEDNICSTGKVTEEVHPILEEAISSEIHRSLKGKESTRVKLNFHSLFDEDKFDDWMLKMLNLGDSEYDGCSLPEVDEEEEDLINSDVSDEYNMKKISYKETIENGFKWMSEECLLAFTKSVGNFNFEGIEHKFGKLHSQCLSVESCNKTFHHYNFSVEEKHKSSDVWTSNLYFAEVKQLFGVKIYFCCLLDQNDNGHCYGCKNQDMYDLKHPIRGGYEEGDAGICWPFMDDPDSDDDCGLGY